MDRALILAGDVGGTKTACVLMTGEGRVLGRGTGGSGNTNFIPLRIAKQSFTDAIRQAQKRARIKSLEVDRVVVATEPKPDPVAPLLRQLTGCRTIVHKKEGESTMVGGLVSKVGLSLICGTGSVGWGRNAKGETSMTSCWGPIGDEGSAYWLATQGVNAAFWAWDGRGRKTVLSDRILEMYDVAEPRDVPTPLYSGDNLRKSIADLSFMVTQAAAEGDRVARGIMREGAHQIALFLTTCAANLKMGGRPYRIAPTGGLVTDFKSLYVRYLKSELKKVHPKAQLVPPKFEPVIGSCLIALDELGIAWTRQLVGTIEKGLASAK